MTPLEWILSAVILISGGGNYKQHLELRKAANEIELHADKEVENAKELEELYARLKQVNLDLSKKVLEIEDVQTKADEKHSELEKQVALDISIAYEQAKDIFAQHDSPFTQQHLKTLQMFLDNWDYDAMAGVIKWNLDVIKLQQERLATIKAERAQLYQQRDAFRNERDDLKVKYSRISGQHEEVLKVNTLLGNTGKDLSTRLNEKVEAVTGMSARIADYLWSIKVAIFCAVLFLLYNIYQWFQGKGIREVKEVAQRELVKRNSIFKEFFRANDDGNATLMKILEDEDIDLEENGNGGSKKALKNKKKKDEQIEMEEFRKWQRQKLVKK
jgi:hypothetical protein